MDGSACGVRLVEGGLQPAAELGDDGTWEPHAEHGSQAGAGSTSQVDADCGQVGTQSLGALATPSGEAGYLLRERLTWALGCSRTGTAGPAAGVRRFVRRSGRQREAAGRSCELGSSRLRIPSSSAGRGAWRVKAYLLDIHVHRWHRDVRDRRDHQRLSRTQRLPRPGLPAPRHRPPYLFGRLRTTSGDAQPSLTVAAARKLSQNCSAAAPVQLIRRRWAIRVPVIVHGKWGPAQTFFGGGPAERHLDVQMRLLSGYTRDR